MFWTLCSMLHYDLVGTSFCFSMYFYVANMNLKPLLLLGKIIMLSVMLSNNVD